MNQMYAQMLKDNVKDYMGKSQLTKVKLHKVKVVVMQLLEMHNNHTKTRSNNHAMRLKVTLTNLNLTTHHNKQLLMLLNYQTIQLIEQMLMHKIKVWTNLTHMLAYSVRNFRVDYRTNLCGILKNS